MITAPIILLAGPPAVGKSTVSRALSKQYDKLMHIEVDKIRESVLSGYLMPDPAWPPEVMEQINLARAAAIDIARRYRAAGFVVVIDDFTDGRGLEAYRPLLADHEACGWVFYPGIEATLERCHARGGELEAFLEEAIRYCYGEMREQIEQGLITDGWQLIEDPSLTPDAIASKIALSIAP